MVEVKICGVREPAAMDAVAEAGADWVGFVFFPASPRFVTPAAAAALAIRHPRGPAPVGLFVEPDDETLQAVLDQVPLGVLQIYSDANRAAAIQTRFGVPVWHAIGVAGAEDLVARAPGVRRLLLDRKPAPEDTRPGGNAQPFDWSVLRGWQAPVPWVLAGGLDARNVAEAIRQTGAKAVDVSSGVERSKGVKDPDLIAAFVRNAHGAGIKLPT